MISEVKALSFRRERETTRTVSPPKLNLGGRSKKKTLCLVVVGVGVKKPLDFRGRSL